MNHHISVPRPQTPDLRPQITERRGHRWPGVGRQCGVVIGSVGVIVLMTVGLWGCGKVGDPLPPSPRLPLRTKGLAVTQQGSFILLQWPSPNVRTLRSLGFTLRRFDVYRLPEVPPAPDQISEAEFINRATLIGSIDERQISNLATGESVIYRDGPVTRFNRAYRYAVRYISTRGESAALSNVVLINPSPRVARPPKNVRLRDQAQDVVALTWDAPTANIDGSPSPPIIGYNVYRRLRDEDRFGPPLNGATPAPRLRYLDRQFNYAARYVYTVRALSRTPQGDVIESADAELVTHTPEDVFPPVSPRDLTAGSANSVISLFWTANSESDLAGYNIYRAERADAPEPEWSKLNSALHTLTTFRDRNTVRGTTYFYKVTAVDRAGNASGPSAIVQQEAQ